DGVLSIRKEDGSQLASGDDRAGSSDPMVDFTIPKGISKVNVAVKDMLGRGGSEYVYRIAIRDLGRPDFSLALTTDKIDVPAGGRDTGRTGEGEKDKYNRPNRAIAEESPGGFVAWG